MDQLVESLKLFIVKQKILKINHSMVVFIVKVKYSQNQIKNIKKQISIVDLSVKKLFVKKYKKVDILPVYHV